MTLTSLTHSLVKTMNYLRLPPLDTGTAPHLCLGGGGGGGVVLAYLI